MDDLKPCPFCGSSGELVVGGFGEHLIRCSNTSCQAGLGGSCWQIDKATAYSAWNRRSLPGQEGGRDADCVCHGNWRLLVKECQGLFGKKYIEDRTGDEYTFYGLVHADDDYYYGMYKDGQAQLLSCVGSLEQFGFNLKSAAREGK